MLPCIQLEGVCRVHHITPCKWFIALALGVEGTIVCLSPFVSNGNVISPNQMVCVPLFHANSYAPHWRYC